MTLFAPRIGCRCLFRMPPLEVIVVRDVHPVARGTEVLRMTGAARLRLTHAVRARPVRAMGHAPWTRSEALGLGPLVVTRVALGSSISVAVTLHAIRHLGRARPRCCAAVSGRRVAVDAGSALSTRRVVDRVPLRVRHLERHCFVASKADVVGHERTRASRRRQNTQSHREDLLRSEGDARCEIDGHVARGALHRCMGRAERSLLELPHQVA